MRTNSLFLITWTVIIMVLTLLPGRYISHIDVVKIRNLDKVVHAVLFMVFAILFYSSMATDIFLSRYMYLPWVLTLITSVGYGIIIELFQKYIPGRDPDVKDVIADTTGALLGVFIVLIKKNLTKKKNS